MLSIEWFDGEVPSGLPVRQVYGVIFTEDGRMLLKVDLKPNGKKLFHGRKLLYKEYII